jgi:hypothetical protein
MEGWLDAQWIKNYPIIADDFNWGIIISIAPGTRWFSTHQFPKLNSLNMVNGTIRYTKLLQNPLSRMIMEWGKFFSFGMDLK